MNTSDILQAGIPILWIFTSAAIGLLLYKTSGAILRKSGKSNSGIRLTGSAAIAACAFFGLWYTTTHPANEQTRAQIKASYNDAMEVQRLTLEVAAALDSNDADLCRQRTEALRAANERLLVRLRQADRYLDY